MGVQVSVRGIKRLHDVRVMSFSRLFFGLLVLSVFVVPLFVPEVFCADGVDVAAFAIDRAEVAMVSAYAVVLDAEQVGVNVSGLLAELNVGGEYLVEAHVWFGLGNFENATHLADLCFGAVVGVEREAVELKKEAEVLRVNDHVLRMVGSMVGVVIVVFLGFVGWRVFKRRYRRRFLGLRPEVGSGES